MGCFCKARFKFFPLWKAYFVIFQVLLVEYRETPAFLMTTHTAGRAEHNSGHWPSVNTGRPVASNIKYKYLLRNHIFFKIYLLGKLSWGTHREIGSY